MQAGKMDLLIKRLDERAIEKKEVMHINDFGMICEECQETGHTGTNCPELAEDINYISNTTTITILSKTKARTGNNNLTTQTQAVNFLHWCNLEVNIITHNKLKRPSSLVSIALLA